MERILCADRVFTGQRVVPRGCVEVRGRLVSWAGTRGEAEGDIVELRGYTLMPGLIDAHVHVTGFRGLDYVREALTVPFGTLVARGVRDLESMLMAGYTTIVDAGSIVSLHLRDAEREGTIAAPRIVAAGAPLSQTGGHGDTHFLPPELVDPRTSRVLQPWMSLLCDGPSSCRAAARYAFRMGSDFIKVFTSGGIASMRDRPEHTQMSLPELRAVVEEAEKRGSFVHAHAEGAGGVILALDAGVTRIAHAIYIDDDGINLARERGAVIIPTLTIMDLLVRHADQGLPEWAARKAREAAEAHVENIRRAYREGVRIAAGTDLFLSPPGAGLYGLNSMEILLLVEKIGLTPMEALQAATLEAAYVAGLQGRAGLLAPGYLADLIAVRGDPLEDPSVLLGPENVHLVVKEGRIAKNTLPSEAREELEQ